MTQGKVAPMPLKPPLSAPDTAEGRQSTGKGLVAGYASRFWNGLSPGQACPSVLQGQWYWVLSMGSSSSLLQHGSDGQRGPFPIMSSSLVVETWPPHFLALWPLGKLFNCSVPQCLSTE